MKDVNVQDILVGACFQELSWTRSHTWYIKTDKVEPVVAYNGIICVGGKSRGEDIIHWFPLDTKVKLIPTPQ